MSPPITPVSPVSVPTPTPSAPPPVPLRERLPEARRDASDGTPRDTPEERNDDLVPVAGQPVPPRIAQQLRRWLAAAEHGAAATPPASLPANPPDPSTPGALAALAAPCSVADGSGPVGAPDTQRMPLTPPGQATDARAVIQPHAGEVGTKPPVTPGALTVPTPGPADGTERRAAPLASSVSMAPTAASGDVESAPRNHLAERAAPSRVADTPPPPAARGATDPKGGAGTDPRDAATAGQGPMHLQTSTGIGGGAEGTAPSGRHGTPAVPPAPTEGIRQLAAGPAPVTPTLTVPFQSWGDTHSVIATWSPASVPGGGLQGLTLRGTSGAVADALQAVSMEEGADVGTWRITPNEKSGDAPHRRSPPPVLLAEDDA